MVKFGFAMRSAFFVCFGCAAQSAPLAPSNLQCPDPGINGQPGQLVAQVDVDPISVDMVSFMAARADDPEKWPFVHYSVLVGVSDGATVSGTIPGLEAGADYLLMARAHARNQSDGYFIFWSDVAHRETPCKAGGVGSPGEPSTRMAGSGAVDTAWIEVFRFNGNVFHGIGPRNNVTLPDYIEAHNAADLNGAFMNTYGVMFDHVLHMNASYTRYCIEMEVVELRNVTTPNNWVPGMSHFADYNSCTSGNCRCMIRVDREWIGQPMEQIVAQCGEPEPGHIPRVWDNSTPCECATERQAESEKYIGMIHNAGGRWYSFPPGGYCAPGAHIGDAGCTYRMSPLSHSLSVGNLYSKGVFNESTDGTHWLQTVRAAFDDLGAELCSGAASAIHEQIIMT